MSAPRQLPIVVFVVLAAVLGGSCTSDELPTSVELCGDLSVPEDIEAVRVVISDQDGKPLREGVRELWTCPGPRLLALPQTLQFESVSGDVFVTVQGLKDGVPVLQSKLRTELSGEDNRASVALYKSCIGAQCAAGETCVQGECELVALASRAVSRCSTAAPPEPDTSGDADASVDAAEPADVAVSDDAGTGQPNPGAYLCPEEDAGVADAGGADAANQGDAP